MRLWSLHPRYLDRQGLLALWREGLLAQQVILGRTRGYRRHPQLARFLSARDPAAAIGAYLCAVAEEAGRRGYAFDRSRVRVPGACGPPLITVSRGQLEYEWRHLMAKLEQRSPERYETYRKRVRPRAHPLFSVVPGGVESWERTI